MDGKRFDSLLLKSMDQRAPRRAALGLILGLVAMGTEEVSSRRKRRKVSAAGICKVEGKACKKTSQCCSDLECLPSQNGPKNPNAGSGSTAGSGKVCTAVDRGYCAEVPDFTCSSLATQCGTGGPLDYCFCDKSAEGLSSCVTNWYCDPALICSSTADCASGNVCVLNSCCGIGQCVAPCPNPYS